MTSAKTLPSDASILIILMGSLGDVVRGLYLVPHIKSTLPASRITWLIEPQWAELVGFHPQIDNLIVFDRPFPSAQNRTELTAKGKVVSNG